MKAPSRIASVAVSVTLLMFSAYAGAYSVTLSRYDTGQLVRWPTPNLTYYIDSRGVSGISSSQSQNVMKSCFQEWEDISCSALTFEFLGNSSSQDILPITLKANNRNELVWVSGSSECKAWQFGESALGVTLPLSDLSTGEITEADIAFNDCNYNGQWAVTADGISWSKPISFTSVAIHEMGHFFGQQHVLDQTEYSESDPPTMAPYVDYYGRGDDLNADDQKGACFLYPDPDYYSSSQGFFKCSKTADCPRIITYDGDNKEVYDYDNFTNGRLACSNGFCVGVPGTSPGTVLFGSLCVSEAACKSPMTCMDIGDGNNRCTQTCNLDAYDCPSGYHCATTGGRNVCVIGGVARPVGENCIQNADCQTKYCYLAKDGTKTCRVKCSNDSGCADGESCIKFNALGACFAEIPVEKKAVGESCTVDSECDSNVCAFSSDDGRLCRTPCAAAGSCAAGYHCDVVDKGCLPGDEPTDLKNVGETCGANIECVSGICMEDTDGKLCRQGCQAAGTCAAGFHCEIADKACLPGEEPVDPRIVPEGGECTDDAECETSFCFAQPGTSTKFCRRSCSLEDWACATDGTACVGFGDDAETGVCMPTAGKSMTGDECSRGADCITGICLGTSADEPLYCAQNCVGEWCPDGYRCADGRTLGMVCLKDDGEQPQQPTGSSGCSGSSTSGGPFAVMFLVLLAAAGFLLRRLVPVRR